jgi:hypothetical protein
MIGISAAPLSVSRRILAIFSILGVFVFGVFITWLYIVKLRLPLPRDPLGHKLATTLLQSVTTILLPYLWAWRFLGLSPAQLGFTTKNLWKSVLWGCALYALGFLAFSTCTSDPLLSRHPIRHANASQGTAILLTMGLHAATTDFATRGYILLALAAFGPVWLAIVMQNLVWFYGHIYEINLFAHCLGMPVALTLFIGLGLLGDIIALRTRNVAGLAIAHVVLNVAMALSIRGM